MHDFDLTLVNYRCFSSASPVHMQMRSGITALVGPNNSGKSTFLRFFYEFREVFRALAQRDVRISVAQNNTRGFNFLGTGDPAEMYFNGNRESLRIELRLKHASELQMSGIDITGSRATPNQLEFQIRVGPRFEAKRFAGSGNLTIHEGNMLHAVDDTAFEEVFSALSSARYIPSTRIAIGEAQGDIFDLQFGTRFIQQWDSWKTGNNREQNEAIQNVTKDVARLFGFDRLEIAATPDKRDLHIDVNGRPFKLRELGSGIAQFVLVLANLTINRPSWLLIDEPEISLHPSLQLDFLTSICNFPTCGTIFATHSIGLARAAADRAFSVQRLHGSAQLKALEETHSIAEFLGEMSFAAYRELGYDAVLLVEGVNDIKTAQQFLRIFRKDHRVVVVHLGGAQMIQKKRANELSEILRLTSSLHVLIDSERKTANAVLDRSRSEFLAECEALRIRAKATERRAIENYFSDRATKTLFGDKSRCLAPFEKLSEAQATWSKTDGWRIAREMKAEEIADTDLGAFIGDI